MDIYSLLGIILITVLLSAFFSGMEIAFISSNTFKIEVESSQGDFRSRLLSRLLQRPSRFIAAMLIGNNIALVLYGIFMARALDPFLMSVGVTSAIGQLLVQTIISTLIILLFAEFLPKAIFSARSHGALKTFSLPVFLFYFLLYPLISFMMVISNGILKLVFGGSADDEAIKFGRQDLDIYLKEHTSADEEVDQLESEVQIFQNALEFANLKVRECMIPRTELIAVDVNTDPSEVRAKFTETGLSKILIYRESIDEIIGYVHLYELFKKPKDLRSVLLPVIMVPETMAASELLNQLIREHRSMAVVLDEFGGTAGIVTIEDAIEEIFGEIEDEHDSLDLMEDVINESEFCFSARLEVDYLNEKYKLSLPESDNYETIGGLIFQHLENMPEEGEVLRVGDYQLTVKQMEKNRIDQVKLRILEE
jgi:CBS domain containing-hemolysin-like protein